jgi:FemAB-related protein (PEP-CTERM system-associated)
MQSEAEWNAFVARSRSANIYHDARWKSVFERACGHACHYLTALVDGEIAGVLPLVEMKSVVFGHFLVSLPFVTYGGMATEHPETASALTAAAVRLGLDLGVRHVELRQVGASPISLPCRRHKVALTVPLKGSAEEYWARLSSRLRGKVRKAERAGASFEVLGPDGLDSFYAVFALNMRDLGTPVYPKSFFRNILGAFPSSSRVCAVRWRGTPVAAALAIRNGMDLHLPWIAADYACSKNYVNEFLYWSTLQWAWRQGVGRVDLGRSTAGGGNHRFKQQWLPDETLLHWYYWMPEDGTPPGVSPDNPRYSLAIRCWRRLPLAVANWLGPKVARNIP